MSPDLTPREQDRLRDLLDEATADVQPHGGLDAIRTRTKVTPMPARPWFLGTAAAVLATAATISAIALTGGGAPSASRDPGPAGTDPTTAEESPSESPSETPSETPNEGETSDGPVAVEGAVPVYYVGDTGQGPRLYREFHAGIGGAPLDQAVADAVGRAPDDPDYRTPWPAGTTATATEDTDSITVTITSPDGTSLHDRPSGIAQPEAEMAVQQLVWTVQAATQTTPPVQFLLDGGRTDQLLGVPVSEPLARGSQADTLAQVWIIDPAQGATVSDGFTVNGVGAFYEANVAWELHRGGLDGPVVASNADNPVMAEECCRMAPYSFTVDLPDAAAPGEYTLRVHDEDMSGGAEGFPPFEDTKTVTLTP